MKEVEAYVIRTRVRKINKFINFLAPNERTERLVNPPCQIFVPDWFVIGNYENCDGDLNIHSRNIVYRTSEKVLESYQRAVSAGAFETIKTIKIKESMLESMLEKAENNIKARNQYDRARIDALDEAQSLLK